MEFRLTWASRRNAADLLPCGVEALLTLSAEHCNDLATLLVLALLPDSATMRMWAKTEVPGHLSGLSCAAGFSAKELATILVGSLIEVAQAAGASEQRDGHMKGRWTHSPTSHFSTTESRSISNVRNKLTDSVINTVVAIW